MAKAFPPSIVLASVLSVVNIIIICLPGVYFARRGLVSQDMRRSIGHMSFNFLLPTLTFVNIAPQVDSQELRKWWPAAVNIIISRLVSLATGWASSRLPWTKPEHRKIVIAASAFGNTNSALLMLVSAMCAQQSLPFFGALGDQCVKNGFAYVAIGLAASSFLTFPVAVRLLKPRQPKSLAEAPVPKDIESSIGTQEASAMAGKLADADADGPLSSPSTFRQHEATRRSSALAGSASAPARAWRASPFERMSFHGQQGSLGADWPADGPREAHAFKSIQSFNAQQAMLAASGPEEPEKAPAAPSPKLGTKGGQAATRGSANSPLGAGKGGLLSSVAQQVSPHLRRLRDSRVGRAGRTLLGWANSVMPPPTIASLSGLVVGCSPFLKSLMIPAGSAPLGFIMTALETISDAFVYLVSFILGAVLQKGPGDGSRLIGWGSIMMTVLNRFLILPVLGCVWIFGSYKLGWWIQPDPLFTFLLLMTNATPTGNQVQAVCAMYHTCEKECGAILFWQYMASVAGIPVWMVIFLKLMGLFSLA